MNKLAFSFIAVFALCTSLTTFAQDAAHPVTDLQTQKPAQPELPDFMHEPWKLVDTGKSKSKIHPEWGPTALFVFADDTGNKIAIFVEEAEIDQTKEASYTPKYAEWLAPDSKDPHKAVMRGYNVKDKKFVFEKEITVSI